MNEKMIQDLSKALTHLIFRNGIVEDLHSENRCLNDETMKLLNKDINNRLYTILSAFHGEDVSEKERVNAVKTIDFTARFYGANWDKAEKIEMFVE